MSPMTGLPTLGPILPRTGPACAMARARASEAEEIWAEQRVIAYAYV